MNISSNMQGKRNLYIPNHITNLKCHPEIVSIKAEIKQNIEELKAVKARISKHKGSCANNQKQVAKLHKNITILERKLSEVKDEIVANKNKSDNAYVVNRSVDLWTPSHVAGAILDVLGTVATPLIACSKMLGNFALTHPKTTAAAITVGYALQSYANGMPTPPPTKGEIPSEPITTQMHEEQKYVREKRDVSSIVGAIQETGKQIIEKFEETVGLKQEPVQCLKQERNGPTGMCYKNTCKEPISVTINQGVGTEADGASFHLQPGDELNCITKKANTSDVIKFSDFTVNKISGGTRDLSAPSLTKALSNRATQILDFCEASENIQASDKDRFLLKCAKKIAQDENPELNDYLNKKGQILTSVIANERIRLQELQEKINQRIHDARPTTAPPPKTHLNLEHDNNAADCIEVHSKSGFDAGNRLHFENSCNKPVFAKFKSQYESEYARGGFKIPKKENGNAGCVEAPYLPSELRQTGKNDIEYFRYDDI